MTVISASSCIHAAELVRDGLYTMWPNLCTRIQESSDAWGFLVVYDGTAEQFEAITGLVIKYDLDHLA
jgi:hypothetical protein